VLVPPLPGNGDFGTAVRLDRLPDVILQHILAHTELAVWKSSSLSRKKQYEQAKLQSAPLGLASTSIRGGIGLFDIDVLYRSGLAAHSPKQAQQAKGITNISGKGLPGTTAP
jgi:hypothetical protein